jgi:hypothetical protein
LVLLALLLLVVVLLLPVVPAAHVQLDSGSVHDVPLTQRALRQPPQSLHVRL